MYNDLDSAVACFCRNAVWLRKYYSIPKKRMAQLLGISIGGLNRLESGEISSKITVTTLRLIYKNFGISADIMIKNNLEDIWETVRGDDL